MQRATYGLIDVIVGVRGLWVLSTARSPSVSARLFDVAVAIEIVPADVDALRQS